MIEFQAGCYTYCDVAAQRCYEETIQTLFGNQMIPIGYMAKRVVAKPNWLQTNKVEDILSVSECISENFADWTNYWKHNGYWFFDSPEVIVSLADEHNLDLSEARWFYFEAYEKEFDEVSDEWRSFDPEASFATCVVAPKDKTFMGYDIITFSCGTSAECSPLSCNHVAGHMKVNPHCLLDSFDEAMIFMDTKAYLGGEPGPYRVFAVYEVPTPKTTACPISDDLNLSRCLFVT